MLTLRASLTLQLQRRRVRHVLHRLDRAGPAALRRDPLRRYLSVSLLAVGIDRLLFPPAILTRRSAALCAAPLRMLMRLRCLPAVYMRRLSITPFALALRCSVSHRFCLLCPCAGYQLGAVLTYNVQLVAYLVLAQKYAGTRLCGCRCALLLRAKCARCCPKPAAASGACALPRVPYRSAHSSFAVLVHPRDLRRAARVQVAVRPLRRRLLADRVLGLGGLDTDAASGERRPALRLLPVPPSLRHILLATRAPVSGRPCSHLRAPCRVAIQQVTWEPVVLLVAWMTPFA